VTRGEPVALGAALDVDVPGPVLAYFDAINGEAWEDLAALWSAGSVLRAVGTRPRTGGVEIVEYFRQAFAPWATHADVPTRFIVAGETVVVEIKFTGETQAGRALEFDAIDVFEVNDQGTLASLATWYDLVWVRAQL
jgi:ketosteroid isomerase-like protein